MELIEYIKEYQGSLEKFLMAIYDIMKYQFTDDGMQFDMETISSRCINSGGEFWLIVQNNDVIGTVGLKLIDPINQIGEIKRLFVLPQYQGIGLGKMLMFKAIDDSRKKEFTCLRLYTTQNSQKALNLYRGIGFYEIKGYVDSEVAEVYMEYKLE